MRMVLTVQMAELDLQAGLEKAVSGGTNIRPAISGRDYAHSVSSAELYPVGRAGCDFNQQY